MTASCQPRVRAAEERPDKMRDDECDDAHDGHRAGAAEPGERDNEDVGKGDEDVGEDEERDYKHKDDEEDKPATLLLVTGATAERRRHGRRRQSGQGQA